MNIHYSLRSLLSPSRLFIRYDLHPNKTIKRFPTVILLHGIGNNAHTWDEIIDKTPRDARYLAIDLLGFGESPKPDWESYDAKSHAKALARTLRKQRLKQPVIIVGHSLGALVAIEYARKHPRQIKHLILCSPPFYRPPVRKRNSKLLPRDEVYRKLYQAIRKNSNTLVKPAKLYSKYLSLNKGRNINEDTLPAFIKSLEASIENQSSFDYMKKLRIKTDIVYGRFDILLIKKNLQAIQKVNPTHISLHGIAAGHEVVGLYSRYLSRHIKHVVATYQAPDRPR